MLNRTSRYLITRSIRARIISRFSWDDGDPSERVQNSVALLLRMNKRVIEIPPPHLHIDRRQPRTLQSVVLGDAFNGSEMLEMQHVDRRLSMGMRRRDLESGPIQQDALAVMSSVSDAK